VVELDSVRSASDSSTHGPMTSVPANASSHRQRPRSAPNCRPCTASGNSTAAPIVVRTNTSIAGDTSSTATLIRRYGVPQMMPMARNSNHPRRLTLAAFPNGRGG
jgi:hypothetical protein